MEIEFIVPGEPQGKQRPKFTTIGGFARAYTPKKTAEYEKKVKALYNMTAKQSGSRKFEEDEPVKIEITAYYKIPASVVKKDKLRMLAHKLLPLKKPDIDNVVKIILDALNGVAWADDKQVAVIIAQKEYAVNPGVYIKISEMETETDDVD